MNDQDEARRDNAAGVPTEWIVIQSVRGVASAVVTALTAADAERLANEGADMDYCGIDEIEPSSRWRVAPKGKKGS
jgi:hypothetical protein